MKEFQFTGHVYTPSMARVVGRDTDLMSGGLCSGGPTVEWGDSCRRDTPTLHMYVKLPQISIPLR